MDADINDCWDLAWLLSNRRTTHHTSAAQIEVILLKMLTRKPYMDPPTDLTTLAALQLLKREWWPQRKANAKLRKAKDA